MSNYFRALSARGMECLAVVMATGSPNRFKIFMMSGGILKETKNSFNFLIYIFFFSHSGYIIVKR